MSTTYIIIIVSAVVLIAGVIAALLLIRPHPQHKRDSHSLYTEGLDFLLRGNLKQAYHCFKGVVERDTDHISAYLKLGQVMRLGGAADRALKLHESLLARPNLKNYDQVELLKNLALDHGELHQYNRSVERCLDILKLAKRDTWALRHLVNFYRHLGDWESTGKYLLQWQKVTNNENKQLQAYCRFRQGYDQRHKESPQVVRNSYKQALKIDDKFALAHFFLAESYESEAYRYRIELNSEGRSRKLNTTRSDQELQEKTARLYSKAVAHWAAYVDVLPTDTSAVLPRVEDALFYLQRFDDVEQFLKKVLNKDPDNPDAIASLSNFYVQKGDLDRAEQLLSTIPEIAASNPLMQAIRFKLSYRQDPTQNLMPLLDTLVDSIRFHTKSQLSRQDVPPSLMGWLDPSSDPLDKLE